MGTMTAEGSAGRHKRKSVRRKSSLRDANKLALTTHRCYCYRRWRWCCGLVASSSLNLNDKRVRLFLDYPYPSPEPTHLPRPPNPGGMGHLGGGGQERDPGEVVRWRIR